MEVLYDQCEELEILRQKVEEERGVLEQEAEDWLGAICVVGAKDNHDMRGYRYALGRVPEAVEKMIKGHTKEWHMEKGGEVEDDWTWELEYRTQCADE